ncbi:MAG: phosphopyruvate hydratase [Parcubacteria group bacterium CG_4_9_14_0_2_um_filter_41_8]|nr:MAG: phosphopyruvate hydratase [Parcubacteria group bacterium CG10_big_fil_rev_8_21_14_0_10_41_35]PJC40286.1 MAG: phosphopyruvate hydratase [Parcubacteria group bacterium CG_4_9_14_0_2_um_filter_41_8]
MVQTKIKHIEAGEILDSRGNPTVMATVILSSGIKAMASVPSGASTGSLEALELRDNNPKRYAGMGVLKACSNVNVKIAQALNGMDAADQRSLDKAMINLDGTPNKSNLGANAILGVSLACSRAYAQAQSKPLYESLRDQFSFPRITSMPIPIMNIINGGKHASTNIALQEFQIIPLSNKTVSEKIETGSEIFHILGDLLKARNMDSDVGNEGGYAPDVSSLDEIFELFKESIAKNNMRMGIDVALGIDAAANSFYNARKKQYIIAPPEQKLDPIELSKLYARWAEQYHVISIEDPFEEEGWNDWTRFTSAANNDRIMIIGDDLLVTNKDRLKQAIQRKAVNAILIKPNQIGTLSETIATIKLAKKNNIKIVISHRSGETNDAFISDLAVACSADFIKAGAPSRGERVAKYNRLMEIEREIR